MKATIVALSYTTTKLNKPRCPLEQRVQEILYERASVAKIEPWRMTFPNFWYAHVWCRLNPTNTRTSQTYKACTERKRMQYQTEKNEKYTWKSH